MRGYAVEIAYFKRASEINRSQLQLQVG